LEFLNSSNLEILNQDNDPTYCSAFRLEVIDITLGPFGLLGHFKSWEVSSGPSLSDRRHVLFTLEGYLFQEGLNGIQERGTEMSMKDETCNYFCPEGPYLGL
jgi:hypothetical protein